MLARVSAHSNDECSTILGVGRVLGCERKEPLLLHDIEEASNSTRRNKRALMAPASTI